MKLFVCLLSVMLMLEGYRIKGCFQNERDGLLQIESYFTSIPSRHPHQFPKWTVVANEMIDCCEWEGVGCSPDSGHVTHLFLNDTAVWSDDGWSLNMSVFDPFQELTTLDLSDNRIPSLVQSEGVPVLMSLQELDLRGNALQSLPDFIFHLSSLRILDLHNNSLEGSLDARLCKLRNILELRFSYNILYGSLPACLWNLTSLRVLELSSNSISGNLPSSINLPSLEYLSIRDNNFQGKFSLNSLTNSSNLKGLMLSDNALQVELFEEAQIPSTMQLQVFGLANCRLSSIQTKSLKKFLSFQSNLQFIDLSSNSLIGSFPTWLLQNNSNLQVLMLTNNLLTGDLQIPQLSNLQKFFSFQSNIVFIDLSNNNLIGSFPTWLLQYNSNLRYLKLRNNSLTGEFQIPQLSNLSLFHLDISSNNLSGKIPHHIGMTLSALQFLNMSDNIFEGLIQPSLSNLTQLYLLDLSDNKLSGEVPKGLFSDCFNLGYLALSNNNLVGEITPTYMSMPMLETLLLDGNHLGGSLKESLKISTSLNTLDISNNKATGKLPSWIGSFSQLELISFAGNQFHGSMPNQICNMENLTYLDLSKNRLIGKIPSCGFPSRLGCLLLHGNNITGSIPLGLQRCSDHLSVLDLARNRLSGGIPRWIHKVSNLRILLLGDNQLQGELSIQLCKLHYLNILDLSNNNISGAIPPCFQNLSFGAFEGHVSDEDHKVDVPHGEIDFFDQNGEIDFIVKKRYASYKGHMLDHMSSLDLSCNQLTGAIPPQLGDLQELHALNLSHNRLSGPIPKSFSKLRSLESLDVSNNKLSGAIPPELVDLNFLGTFNVSFNNLSGQVPETGQFGDFDESNYGGNPLLCGSLLVKSCSIAKLPASPSVGSEDDGDTSGFDFEVFFWSLGMSAITVLVAFFMVLYINVEWRRAWFIFIDYHFLWWFHP